MTRPAIILLMLSIAFANALCVCAMTSPNTPTKTARACHQSAKSKPSDQKNSSPRECAHCSGATTMDASGTKTIAPAMTVLDSPFVLPMSLEVPTPRTTAFASIDHTGLSPPVAGRTLLDLACSMNT
jgi:hypothetical protein